MSKPLHVVIEGARWSMWTPEAGHCTMCHMGQTPVDGWHHNKNLNMKARCANADGCLLCHNAGMPVGEHCRACGRVNLG